MSVAGHLPLGSGVGNFRVPKSIAKLRQVSELCGNLTRPIKEITELATKFGTHLLFAFFAATLMTWLVVSWLLGGTPTRMSVAWAVFLIWLCGMTVVVGLYLVHRENLRLRQCAYELHEINHIYRDALGGLFSNNAKTQPPNADELLLVEREVLNAVCTKVASMFRNLTGRRCVVTMRLITEEDQNKFCFVWATSDRQSFRDEVPVIKFGLSEKENTAFARALVLRSSSPSFFHSADLRDASDYEDQRPEWRDLYRSILVVPVQHAIRSLKKSDVLGFLSVETMSTYRINNGYHVHFLAAFADQMYNFICIMRRRYVLLPGPGSKATLGEHRA